jgi:hypothetical protein
MLRLQTLIGACLLAASGSFLVSAETTRLTKEQIAGAARVDGVTIPTPGEVFEAINKLGKPNWQSLYRIPIATNYSSRPQTALNIGGLIADGYIAVAAEDKQQVKSIGKDIVALAKTLGVSQNVLSRSSSIADFAENNEWSALREELEATQNEVKLAMQDQNDTELVTMVTLGGWIRGTDAVSSWITENYTPDTAKLIRQPALVAYLRSKIKSLPEKTQADPLVKTVEEKLVALEQMVSFRRDQTPSLEDVKQLRDATAALVKVISSK